MNEDTIQLREYIDSLKKENEALKELNDALIKLNETLQKRIYDMSWEKFTIEQ